MDLLDQLLHLLHFLAPAWAMALLWAVWARFWPQGLRTWARLGAVGLGVLQGILGSLVLVAGLWWTGLDGKMQTYLGLITLQALCQWGFLRWA